MLAKKNNLLELFIKFMSLTAGQKLEKKFAFLLSIILSSLKLLNLPLEFKPVTGKNVKDEVSKAR